MARLGLRRDHQKKQKTVSIYYNENNDDFGENSRFPLTQMINRIQNQSGRPAITQRRSPFNKAMHQILIPTATGKPIVLKWLEEDNVQGKRSLLWQGYRLFDWIPGQGIHCSPSIRPGVVPAAMMAAPAISPINDETIAVKPLARSTIAIIRRQLLSMVTTLNACRRDCYIPVWWY